ncbi:hypothetical protein KI614_09055 [Dechloromonas denitrificans]|uniref:hypothetical protein n=1 Tax=Dechloromonas denitrificans TaxID=281362 RepID=UPI001CF91854|nr:hypothetical protein [Dechloromonas denitrificans]UCV10361.1 hypothetical protein KI614_09055 [Dechloromonas denitrificans]
MGNQREGRFEVKTTPVRIKQNGRTMGSKLHKPPRLACVFAQYETQHQADGKRSKAIPDLIDHHRSRSENRTAVAAKTSENRNRGKTPPNKPHKNQSPDHFQKLARTMH